MTSKPWVMFDLDDTLGGVMVDGQIKDASAAYFDCIERFADYMSSIGFPAEAVKEAQKRIDMKLCEEHGFDSIDRFPSSFELTYEYLARNRGGVHPGISSKVHSIGASVFTDYPYVLYPGAASVVRRTAKHYNVAIVSKGNTVVQLRKIKDCGLLPLVGPNDIFIVPRKDQADWLKVFRDLGLLDQPRTHWAIGNSLRSDVNVPMSMGVNGVLVNSSASWDFEKADLIPLADDQLFYHVDTINDVPDLLGV